MESTPSSERIQSIDVLRGFSLLGILLLNINSFGLPFGAYFNPAVWGGATGADLTTWLVAATWWDGKMRCIFSMLFGASAVIFLDRVERRGAGITGADLYYRRTMWLILIGLLHAHLVWAGDILYGYGVVGLLLFPLRRLKARTLIITGTVIILVHSLQGIGAGYGIGQLKAQAERAEQSQTRSAEDLQVQAQWAQLVQLFATPPDEVQKEIATHRGGWLGNLVLRSGEAALIEFTLFFQFILLDVLAMLIMGMGLYKAGVFSASRSYGFYGVLVAAGFGVGVPLNYWCATKWIESGFDLPTYFTYIGASADIGRFSVAMGYTGLVMLACRAGLNWVTGPLSRVGQMALSNYLLTSVLCTLIFNGYGFGAFASLSRFELLYVVVGVWAVNLIWSPFWLKRYLHGPAEWVWRSLIYWQKQPMRRPVAPPDRTFTGEPGRAPALVYPPGP
jgi:uncharacterized protein